MLTSLVPVSAAEDGRHGYLPQERSRKLSRVALARKSDASPLSSVVERVTCNDEVGCSIQPVGIFFFPPVMHTIPSQATEMMAFRVQTAWHWPRRISVSRPCQMRVTWQMSHTDMKWEECGHVQVPENNNGQITQNCHFYCPSSVRTIFSYCAQSTTLPSFRLCSAANTVK